MIWSRVAALILCAAVAAGWLGCAEKRETEQAADEPQLRITAEGAGNTAGKPVGNPYEGWRASSFENFRIHYPVGHPRADLVYEMAKAYASLMRRDAQFFGIPVPKDTVEVWFYTGVGHGRQITGSIYPMADSLGMHVWLPSDYGPNMAKYMVGRWQPGGTRHEFLREGLVLLLDYTGRNYHKATMERVKDGTFVPLRELAADTVFTSDTDPGRAAQAASFVDFVVFTGGMKVLRAMYGLRDGFAEVVQGIYRMPVDSLEVRWLDLARRAQNPEEFLESLRREREQADSAKAGVMEGASEGAAGNRAAQPGDTAETGANDSAIEAVQDSL